MGAFAGKEPEQLGKFVILESTPWNRYKEMVQGVREQRQDELGVLSGRSTTDKAVGGRI